MVANDVVRITLKTVISDENEQEIIKSNHVGKYYQQGNFHVLFYEDEVAPGMTVRNQITIQPTKVTIKRSGSVTMTQQFIHQKKTEGVYEHAHGNIHMETFTNALKFFHLAKENQGDLQIKYTVKLNGMEKRNHELKLTYQKEG